MRPRRRDRGGGVEFSDFADRSPVCDRGAADDRRAAVCDRWGQAWRARRESENPTAPPTKVTKRSRITRRPTAHEARHRTRKEHHRRTGGLEGGRTKELRGKGFAGQGRGPLRWVSGTTVGAPAGNWGQPTRWKRTARLVRSATVQRTLIDPPSGRLGSSQRARIAGSEMTMVPNLSPASITSALNTSPMRS